MKELDPEFGRELYNRLDLLARDRGTRISTVCDELGLRRALVSDLKTGKTKTIGPNYIAAFARYFHVTMDYLCNGDRSDLDLSHDERALIKAWRACDDSERETVAFILRRFNVAVPKKKQQSSDLMTG